jgi:hypothetical protein
MDAHIDIDGEFLRVSLHGLDIFWSGRRRLVVPLDHVKGARIDPKLARRGPWLGAGYTDALLDYTVAAGPMLVHGRHEFWDVHHPERTVVIDLEGEFFERLVLEVADPEGAATAVNAAVATSRAAA